MSFMKHFEHLPDPRSHINRRHDLLDIMFLNVAATLSGAGAGKTSRHSATQSSIGCASSGVLKQVHRSMTP